MVHPGRPGPDQTTALERVDWAAAEVRSVTLSDYAFEPDELSFTAGRAYRLRLRNRGRHGHTFTAPEFFAAIAVARVSGQGARLDHPRLEGLALAPGERREIAFLARRPGTYRLVCTAPLHAPLFGMRGTIRIAPAAAP